MQIQGAEDSLFKHLARGGERAEGRENGEMGAFVERERKKERKKERQTDRQTERKTERKKDYELND